MGRMGPPGLRLARVLSKWGVCSRAEAIRLVLGGEVRVNGRVCGDPGRLVDPERDRVVVRGREVGRTEPVYLMLNKPRGLVTTASDEQGRATVFECLAGVPWGDPGAGRPPPGLHLGPVGRLDQASEGLLLFTNDTAWAARLSDPASKVEKEYHVQVGGIPDPALLARMESGVIEGGERLGVLRAEVLRAGERNAWLRLVLDEGRNRHLRRLLGALGLEVLRLVRVRIGDLVLGALPKARYRLLERAEVERLARTGRGSGGVPPA